MYDKATFAEDETYVPDKAKWFITYVENTKLPQAVCLYICIQMLRKHLGLVEKLNGMLSLWGFSFLYIIELNLKRPLK